MPLLASRRFDLRLFANAAKCPLAWLSLAYWVAWCFGVDPFMCQPDCVGYYAYAHSVLVDGDLAVANQFTDWNLQRVFIHMSTLGQANDVFACGSAILWLPFVGAMHLFLLLARAFGAAVVADGHGQPYLQAIALATSWYGYLALVLSYRAATRVAKPSVALFATLAIGALTPAWEYLFFEGLLSHALSAFGDALFVYLALTMLADATSAIRRPGVSWATLGLSGGLVTLLRWQEVILPGLVGLLLLSDIGRRLVSRVRPDRARGPRWESAPLSASLWYGSGWLIGFLPQLLIWHLQQGSFLTIPQGAAFFHPWDAAIGFVLFSWHHGLFTWTPLVFFAVLGFSALWKRQPLLAAAALTTFLIQVYVNAIVLDPAGGISFGARRFVSLSVFFVIGLAVVWMRLPRAASLTMSALAACWTIPLWVAYRYSLIDPIRFVPLPELSAAVVRAFMLIPSLLVNARPRFLGWSDAPTWLQIGQCVMFVVGVVGALSIAVRVARSAMVPPRRRAFIAWGTLAIFVDMATALAVARSAPVPVSVIGADRALQIDFGEYANSRFDGNPFDSRYGVIGFHLPPEIHWGQVPFRVSPPPADHRAEPSTMSNCGLPAERFQLPLAPVYTRALHFALVAAGAGESRTPVIRFRVEEAGGNAVERTLYSDVDVWDIFEVPPARAVIHNQWVSITGYTLTLDPALEPADLMIESPSLTGKNLPCVAVFGVTQELATKNVSGAPEYRPVNLGPIANADHGRDAFHPAGRLNYFPQLSPGPTSIDGTSFLILDHHRSPSGNSTLTSAGLADFRIRLPLARVPTTQLAVLVSAYVPSGDHNEVAELEIEYVSGPPVKATMAAGRDVDVYPADIAEPAALRSFVIVLDPHRIPQYLWLRRPKTPLAIDAGIAVFAVTQLRSGSLDANRSQVR